MKILVFGSGKLYQKEKSYLASNADIIAIIDNNKSLYSKYINGVPVISPYDIKQYDYDKIILVSIHANEMKKQLLRLGILAKKIWYWEQFKSEIEHGKFKFYCGNNKVKKRGMKILIISTDLNYNGGSLAAVYAAMAIQKKGYNVVLAASAGDPTFISEASREQINIVIIPALPYLHQEEIFLIQQFDLVMVNVFQMVLCAYEISKIKPVLWWIHEPKTIYENIIYQFSEYARLESLSNINILAVSSIPKNNFNFFFPGRIKNTLSYGIPDRYKHDFYKSGKELTFAIIGSVTPRKAQDIFIQAVRLLENTLKKSVQFWIIGYIGTDTYSMHIRELASQESAIQILGELTQSEINNAYNDIDAVVCPSMEDPLPIVMTEGMMHGKVCITSNANGTIDYIDDGKNGFICKSGDPYDLAKKMQWVIHNKDKLWEIGKQARKTYEKYFTLETFSNRLESALLETIEQYNNVKISPP